MALHAHITIAARSAAFGQPEIRLDMAVHLIKEAVVAGADAPLSTDLLLERRSFEPLFDTAAQKEGVQAFLGRGKPGGVAPRQLANRGGRAATTHP